MRSDMWTFMATLVNLAIFFGLIVYLLKSPVTKAVAGRTSRVGNHLKDLEFQLAEVTKKVDEQSKALTNIEDEIARVTQTGEHMARSLREEILASAQAEGAKMRERAQRDMDQQIHAAMQKLRQDMLQQALIQAENALRERLDDSAQKQLVTGFTAGLKGGL